MQHHCFDRNDGAIQPLTCFLDHGVLGAVSAPAPRHSLEVGTCMPVIRGTVALFGTEDKSKIWVSTVQEISAKRW